MAKNKTIESNEAGAEVLGKLLSKKLGALKWVIEEKKPDNIDKLEDNIKELEAIQKQLQ